MQSQIKWFLIIVIILLSSSDYIYSQTQDLEVEVIVDMSLIPPDAQDKLSNFKRRTEEYLNRNKYFDEKVPPVKVQMQFSFTGLDAVNYDYQAKLFVASKREIYNPFNNGNLKYASAFRYLDERCDFYYNDNMVFLKNDYRFDSFLSLLDYYAYIIAGYDEDSYFVKGGNLFPKSEPRMNGPRFFFTYLELSNISGSSNANAFVRFFLSLNPRAENTTALLIFSELCFDHFTS